MVTKYKICKKEPKRNSMAAENREEKEQKEINTRKRSRWETI